jgi:hypothetical protein
MSNLRDAGQADSTGQKSLKGLPFFGSAVVSGLIGLGTLLLTIYTDRPAVVAPWALCVLGLSAFGPIIPRVPRLAQVCIVFMIAVALISASIVLFVDPKLLTNSPGQAVQQRADIELAPIAEPIPFCNSFVGSGTIPAGYQLWIFDRDAEDPTAKYFLDAQAIPVASNSWSANNIQIGDGAGDTGHRTIVFAVLLPASLMDWVVNTANLDNGLPSTALPPGAFIEDQTIVTRSSDTKPCG